MKEDVRVRPNDEVQIGQLKVTNKTSNSIMVRLAADGSLEVTDCCLEEQGL